MFTYSYCSCHGDLVKLEWRKESSIVSTSDVRWDPRGNALSPVMPLSLIQATLASSHLVISSSHWTTWWRREKQNSANMKIYMFESLWDFLIAGQGEAVPARQTLQELPTAGFHTRRSPDWGYLLCCLLSMHHQYAFLTFIFIFIFILIFFYYFFVLLRTLKPLDAMAVVKEITWKPTYITFSAWKIIRI